MQYSIKNDDVLEWARNYDGPQFHAILCDPPYELDFMGKTWDNSGVAFNSETWALLAQHLLPGGFGMAFAGSRGWHRLAVAIEDAGLIIHPSIFGWGFGCLSEDTEILTADGWKAYHNLFVGLSVACYNTDLDTVDFQPIEEVYTYDYNDTAYHIKSDKTDQIVSRNHRCIVERGGKKIFQQAETLKSKETVPILESVQSLQQHLHNRELNTVEPGQGVLFEDVWSYPMRWGKSEITETGTEERERFSLSRLQKEILQADGVVKKNKRYTDMLQYLQGHSSFSKSRDKRTPKANIEKGGGSGKYTREPQKERDDRGQKPRLERWRYLSQPQRQLSELFNKICSLPSRVFNYGSKRRLCYGASFEGSSTDWASFNTAGGGSPHRPQSRKQRHIEPDAIRNKRRTQSLRGQERTKTSTTMATVTPIHYEGVVWCVKVPTGAFVARRNGKVFVTGNSGFPKATRIDSQIDKAATVDCPDCRDGCNRCNGSGKVSAYDVREVVGDKIRLGDKKAYPINNVAENNSSFGLGNGSGLCPDKGKITTPTTPLAQAFAGHRYGRQALKPALEPIIVFQKPYYGRAVDCITETGAGALNIDGGRIGTTVETWPKSRSFQSGISSGYTVGIEKTETQSTGDAPQGRWPANLTLTHSPECTDGDCTDQCPVRRLGEQSGVLKSGSRKPTGNPKYGGRSFYNSKTVDRSSCEASEGTAARYFFNADWSLDVAEQLATADPVRYQAKASRAERDAGLEGFELKQLAGSNKWTDVDYRKGNGEVTAKGHNNPHPTVKPIKLIEHLATLLLPPERYAPNRRLLVPFSGSGSEMIGAILAGWDYIQGIDLTSEYVEIAHARIKYWSVGQAKSIDNEAPKPKTPTIKQSGQITLF